MPASEAVTGIAVTQPYPGLRPFEPDEELKFYGRETHTTELLRRLSENRFIAVVGNSGSGKSSLVRAGLLPALYRGRLIGATSQWRICIMRPGEAPMKSLAESLAEQKVFSNDSGAVLLEIRRSSLGLVRAVRASHFAPGESLLLAVDQFEELFRFVRERKEEDGGAEARLFVSSLLEAADLSSAPVYVVLTMRSDFLGDCSQFPALPEVLNRSQYLIPRMTREQIRDAIEKPLRLAGARMNGKLVERLLNELGDDTGQLPVLQHALNRTFHEYEKRGAGEEIGVDDYAAAGEMQGASNAHANAVLDSLRVQDPQLERWTEKVFRCLTTLESGRKLRRPTRLDRMYGIVGACDDQSKAKVWRVIKTYSDRDHSMLVWSGRELAGDRIIDISHESLIEHWSLLKDWVTAEADAASLFRSAVEDTVRSRRGAASKWRHLKLHEALGYTREGPWNEAWAERLGPHGARFNEVKAFLEREADAQREEEEERNASQARELAAERRAKEDAEARAQAEQQAKEAAQTLAVAERRGKEDAEARALAEQRAKETAESLANAERQKKRWILASGVLLAVVLGLGLAVLWNLKTRAEAERKRAESDRTLIAARQQITAYDDLLEQYTKQIQDLRNQIDGAAAGEKQRLEAKLKELQDQEKRVREQRDAAAKLGADSNIRARVNPTDGLTYVFIPPGNFTMGCSQGDNDCYDDEKPPRAEQIANGFWLGQTEVTQAAWKKVNGNNNPSHFKSDQLPVESVDWVQAQNYCKAVGGRLPTEKEWDYAARAGTTTPRYGALDAIAWYSGNSSWTTHPVGLKQANAFAVYDMLGNVWEWTADNYDYNTKVVRGGSWDGSIRYVRASSRVRYGLAFRFNNIGFRCVGEFR